MAETLIRTSYGVQTFQQHGDSWMTVQADIATEPAAHGVRASLASLPQNAKRKFRVVKINTYESAVE